jgi:beta-lactamase superfamily II metal-dependent hydrolase
VGQGDATLIVSNDGHSLLVDGGRSKTRIRDRLSALGIQDIDAIAATHPDADHIAGLTEVLAMYKVENVYLNGGQSSTATHADFLDAVEQEGAIVSTLQMNDTFNLGDMVIKVLHPYQLTGDSNVDSLVLQLGCGDVQVLLTGDSEIESEQSMLSENVLQDIDLLKVGHHGSRSSTSQAFLDVILPEVGVISAGFDSQYGHPHVEVVSRLNIEGVQIFETDTTGADDDTLKMTSNCQTYEIGGQVFVPASSGASPVGGNVSPTATPTSLPTPVPTPIATPTPMPTPTIVATSTGTPNLSIECIFFDGVVSRTESDEYVRIVNAGETSVDLSNWSLKDVADGSPTFTFPGYTIAPNETIRVYTNEVHSESGGFSFGLGSSI